jgi:hypothetical protein
MPIIIPRITMVRTAKQASTARSPLSFERRTRVLRCSRLRCIGLSIEWPMADISSVPLYGLSAIQHQNGTGEVHRLRMARALSCVSYFAQAGRSGNVWSGDQARLDSGKRSSRGCHWRRIRARESGGFPRSRCRRSKTAACREATLLLSKREFRCDSAHREGAFRMYLLKGNSGGKGRLPNA